MTYSHVNERVVMLYMNAKYMPHGPREYCSVPIVPHIFGSHYDWMNSFVPVGVDEKVIVPEPMYKHLFFKVEPERFYGSCVVLYLIIWWSIMERDA